MPFGSMRSRAIPPLALAMATSVLIVVVVASWRVAGAGPASDHHPVVSQQVRDEIASSGSARVIVEVQLPTGFVPEGALAAGLAVLAQRANISFAQSQVLGRLQGLGHTFLHRFVTVPYVVLEVEPDALRELEASTLYVRRVVEDAMSQPLLAQSVPLIGADQAWAQGFDGTGKTVAILDTGVDSSHPFLANKVVSEACYSTNNFIAGTVSNCPNGQSEQTGPGSGVNCPVSTPLCWHGTHVAGIATGNGVSGGQPFSGVAKGAQIVAIQVFSHGVTPGACGGPPNCLVVFTSDIVKGLERVLLLSGQYSIAAVNVSVGGKLFSSYCDDDVAKPAIDNLRSMKIATVIATGNGGHVNFMNAPACVSTAVSVSSTTEGDVVSDFSNVASILSLFAPGEPITSSYPGAQYFTANGTSMATPHVTGAFAVLKQALPGASVDTILSALQQTGIPITDTRPGGSVTKSRIRVAAALAMLGGGLGSNTLTVLRSGTGTGTVTSGNGIIHCGAICTATVSGGTQVALTATPTPNSTFTSWSGGCTSVNGTTCTVTGGATVSATFTLFGGGVSLGVVMAGSGPGTVTSNDGKIQCGGTCSATYAGGSGVTLTATPTSGATFKQWGGACSGTTPTCALTLNATQTVTAIFVESFTDGTGPAGTLTPGSTIIKAVHVLELRTAINNLRGVHGVAPFTWADPTLTVGSTVAKGVHVLDLRSAMALLCTVKPGKCAGYTDDALSPGQTVIKAVHLNDLRSNVRALE
jgi:subtilisin family serine protease